LYRYVSDPLASSYHVQDECRQGTNPITIAVTPTSHKTGYTQADVCIFGNFLNPFPIHSESKRRHGFVKGYQGKARKCFQN